MSSDNGLIREWRISESLNAIRFFIEKFEGRYTVAFSHQAEDILLLDLVKKIDPNPDVFTIATGKLFPVADDFTKETEKFFGVKINVIEPDKEEVESMVKKHGEELYYESVELRKLCCHTRKVVPLNRYLKGFPLWLTGLRKEQSPTRSDLEAFEHDPVTGIYKLSPILPWRTEEMLDYIKENGLPHNPLYAENYTSIGCEPCTRPVLPGEDIRRGRWWWEDPSQKECGLHSRKG